MQKSQQTTQKLIFELMQDNLCLAKHECEQLLLTSLSQISKTDPQFFQANVTKNMLPLISRLAFTYRVFSHIGTINRCPTIHTETYKVDFNNCKPSSKEATVLYRKVFLKTQNKENNHAKIRMQKPQKIISLIKIDKTYICEQLFKNTKSYTSRKAHMREKVHPSAISPKLAKAMINCAATNTIYDPFCGTGGILIEALHSKINSIGSDYDNKMVYKARINLQNEIHKIMPSPNIPKTFVADALTITQKAPAFVCDPPYGKNTKSIPNLEQFFVDFLDNAKKLTNTVIFCAPDTVDIKRILQKSGWKCRKICNQYIHKSLTRQIVHATK